MQGSTVSAVVLLLGAVGCTHGRGTSHRGAPHPDHRDAPRRASASDSDGDGVPDFADQCPRKKETRNGYRDDDGCPDVYPLVFGTKRIRLRLPITFATETATLTTAARQLLTTLAKGLRDRPKIMLVEIQGHVAPSGPLDYSRRLSLRRAQAVRRFLVKSGGVSKLRLDVGGYGPTRPVCTEKTRACRARNERVELHIVWQGDRRQTVHRRRAVGRRALMPPRHRSALTRSAALRLRRRRLRKLYEAALRLLKQGRYTTAYQRFRKVVRLHPGHLQARLKLGVLQARVGDHSGAIETVRWVRNNVGDDAADRLRQAQLKVMAGSKP